MEKFLEDYFWNEISSIGDPCYGTEFHRWPKDIIDDMVKKGWIKSNKQAIATLEKWVRKGKYDYGTNLLWGWKNKKEE